MKSICGLSKQRGEKFLLSTYAFYIPEGCSREAFKAGKTDYGRHMAEVETWGEPGNIAKTLKLHNGIIRELAQANSRISFL